MCIMFSVLQAVEKSSAPRAANTNIASLVAGSVSYNQNGTSAVARSRSPKATFTTSHRAVLFIQFHESKLVWFPTVSWRSCFFFSRVQLCLHLVYLLGSAIIHAIVFPRSWFEGTMCLQSFIGNSTLLSGIGGGG